MPKREMVPRLSPRAASEGCVLLAAPAGGVACTVDGTEYAVRAGVVEVPVRVAGTLAAHGYTPLASEG